MEFMRYELDRLEIDNTYQRLENQGSMFISGSCLAKELGYMKQ